MDDDEIIIDLEPDDPDDPGSGNDPDPGLEGGEITEEEPMTTVPSGGATYTNKEGTSVYLSGDYEGYYIEEMDNASVYVINPETGEYIIVYDATPEVILEPDPEPDPGEDPDPGLEGGEIGEEEPIPTVPEGGTTYTNQNDVEVEIDGVYEGYYIEEIQNGAVYVINPDTGEYTLVYDPNIGEILETMIPTGGMVYTNQKGIDIVIPPEYENGVICEYGDGTVIVTPLEEPSVTMYSPYYEVTPSTDEPEEEIIEETGEISDEYSADVQEKWIPVVGVPQVDPTDTIVTSTDELLSDESGMYIYDSHYDLDVHLSIDPGLYDGWTIYENSDGVIWIVNPSYPTEYAVLYGVDPDDEEHGLEPGDNSDPGTGTGGDDTDPLEEEDPDPGTGTGGDGGSTLTPDQFIDQLFSKFADQYYAIQIIDDDLNIFNQAALSGNPKILKFNGYNTWDDFHLIPSSRPLINPPGFKSSFIEVPGAHGAIDASELLTDYPLYSNRSGSFEFYVMRDYDGYYNWNNVYTSILEKCHGRRVKLILSEEKDWYYVGRIAVNSWKSEKDWSKIVIDYQVEPFKYKTVASWDRWLWDPFNFHIGIVPSYEAYNGPNGNGLTVDNNSSVSVPIIAGSAPITPTFKIKSSKKGATINVSKGISTAVGFQTQISHELEINTTAVTEYKFYDISFYNSQNEYIIFDTTDPDATFTLWIRFRERSL